MISSICHTYEPGQAELTVTGTQAQSLQHPNLCPVQTLAIQLLASTAEVIGKAVPHTTTRLASARPETEFPLWWGGWKAPRSQRVSTLSPALSVKGEGMSG